MFQMLLWLQKGLQRGQKIPGPVTLKLTREDRQTLMPNLPVKSNQLAVALLLTPVSPDTPVASDVNTAHGTRMARLLVKGPN